MKYHRVPPSNTSISLKEWERICDKTESDDGCEENRRKRWNNKLKRVFFEKKSPQIESSLVPKV